MRCRATWKNQSFTLKVRSGVASRFIFSACLSVKVSVHAAGSFAAEVWQQLVRAVAARMFGSSRIAFRVASLKRRRSR
jgi:hypothetical protein